MIDLISCQNDFFAYLFCCYLFYQTDYHLSLFIKFCCRGVFSQFIMMSKNILYSMSLRCLKVNCLSLTIVQMTNMEIFIITSFLTISRMTASDVYEHNIVSFLNIHYPSCSETWVVVTVNFKL